MYVHDLSCLNVGMLVRNPYSIHTNILPDHSSATSFTNVNKCTVCVNACVHNTLPLSTSFFLILCARYTGGMSRTQTVNSWGSPCTVTSNVPKESPLFTVIIIIIQYVQPPMQFSFSIRRRPLRTKILHGFHRNFFAGRLSDRPKDEGKEEISCGNLHLNFNNYFQEQQQTPVHCR